MKKIDTVQHDRIKLAVSEILGAIGEDVSRGGLLGTPDRVARMYQELFSGVGLSPEEAIDTVFEVSHNGPVVLDNLTFYSICEHHLLPFFGRAKLGYVPNGKIAGISKLSRALEIVSHRPQVQERLTAEVADAIFNALGPDGVIVEIEAEHLCMAMRGVKKPGAVVRTSAVRGTFENYSLGREGLLSLMRSG